MKVRTIVGLLSLSFVWLAACEESAEQAAEQPAAPAAPDAQPGAQPTPSAEQPKALEITPKEVCEQATEAAKANDEAKLTSLVSGDLTVEGARDPLVNALSGAVCGEPKVDGDKAGVTVTHGTGKKATTKEVPMLKGADGWKIDLAGFQAANPEKAKKGKKAKKAKGKKTKA